MSQYTESGMTFEYDADYVFLPEQSPTYQNLVKNNSIKSCDFVWLKGNKLLLIEVKATAPKKVQDLQTYIQEIHFKFIHTLLLYLGLKFKRPFKVQTTLPTELSTIEIGKEIIPVLIVRNYQNAWLPPLADSIRETVRGIRKAYCLEDILVLNEELARTQGFIV